MVPPLTLQPLAENAVKHGVAKKGGMGKVSISSRRVDDKVHLTVKDNGPGISNEQLQSILRGESDRLGLVNIIRKIDLLEGASIDFKHTQDGFWVLLVFRAI
jgi:sensor histidine kinase YesM